MAKARHAYRVTNPTAQWQTIKLLPYQKIALKLSNCPYFSKKATEKSEFSVNIKGDFLFIEKVETTSKGHVYTISPRYDLSSWMPYGQVLLANVSISIEGTDYHSTLVVIQDSVNDKNLTVVNPKDIAVKFQCHQNISVVCPESSWIFNIKDSLNYKVERLEGRVISKDRVADDPKVKFPVKNRFNRELNPRLSTLFKSDVEKEIEKKSAPKTEHFYWFGLTEESFKNVMNAKNGVFDIGDIELTNKGEKCSLKLLLDIKGKTKYKAKNDIENLSVRCEDFDKNILRNPIESEIVDFCPGRNEIVIEIASPQCFWNDVTTKSKWEISLHCETISFIKVVELPVLSHWGKDIQRFKVTQTLLLSKNYTQTENLGTLIIACAEKEGLEKQVTFWYTPEAKEEDKTHVRSGWKTSPKKHYTPYEHYNYPQKTQYCNVKFEEIESDDLTSHVNLRDPMLRTEQKFCPEVKKKEEPVTTPPVGPTSNVNLARVYVNPGHGEIINVKYDQLLIIKMNYPSKFYSQCENEFWEIQPLIINAIFPDFTPTKNPVQEMRIIVRRDKDKDIRKKTGGSLIFKCSKGVREIFIEMENTKEPVIESVSNVPNNSWIPTDGKVTIRNWEHNDSAIIKHSDQLVIHNPITSWRNEDWNLEVEQLGVNDLWENENLKPFLSKIDTNNPWLGNSPVTISSMWLFRALENTQPYIKEILQLAAQCSENDYLHIAKLIFKNNNHVDNSKTQTSMGCIEVQTKIEKVFNIFLDISEFKNEITVCEPIDGQPVKIKKGKDLVVKYKRWKVDGISQTWMPKNYTQNLIRFKRMKVVDDYCCLVYSVLSEGKTFLTHMCNDMERTIELEII